MFYGRDAEITQLRRLLIGADAAAPDEPAPTDGLGDESTDGSADVPGDEAGASEGAGRVAGITVLLGKAGSGKTSLVAAGLVPRLQAAGRRVAVLAPGEQPLRELALALADLVGGHADTAHDALLAGPAAVRQLLLESDLPGRSGPVDRVIVLPETSGRAVMADQRPVVIVDRFEQLLDGPADRDEQEVFVQALAAAARPEVRAASPAAVLVVLRSEAVAGVARFPDLAAALEAPGTGVRGPAHVVTLGSLNDDQVREVILGPARAAGVEVDADLVEAVVADVAELDRAGVIALPRLSYALLATWRHGRRARLSVAAYRKSGGLIGSVETAAEQAYHALPADDRSRLPALLTGGVTSDAESALRGFVQANLLEFPVAPMGRLPAGLVQGWPRLQAWRAGPEPQRPTSPSTEPSRPPTTPPSTTPPSSASRPATLPLPLASEPVPPDGIDAEPTSPLDGREARSRSGWRWLLALAAAAIITIVLVGLAAGLGR